MPAAKAAVEVKVQDIRHVIRRLGPITDGPNGVTGFNDFEEYLKNSYFAEGWEIEKVEVLGADKGITKGLDFDPVNMLYVLVKRAA